ncbi:MAG: hypothetical protein ACHQ4G_04140 [Opitutales bacterium]
MKRLKLILLLVLVFIAGIFAGVAGTRVAVRHFIRQALHDPDFLRRRAEKDLTRKLKLDAAQQATVQQALLGVQEAFQTAAAVARPHLREALLKANGEIEAVLTPEQKEHYRRIQIENRAEWGGR